MPLTELLEEPLLDQPPRRRDRRSDSVSTSKLYSNIIKRKYKLFCDVEFQQS